MELLSLNHIFVYIVENVRQGMHIGTCPLDIESVQKKSVNEENI